MTDDDLELHLIDAYSIDMASKKRRPVMFGVWVMELYVISKLPLDEQIALKLMKD